MNGIWEKYTDTNDVNAIDTYYEGEVAVTGDDFGLVKLFKFPCLKKGIPYKAFINFYISLNINKSAECH